MRMSAARCTGLIMISAVLTLTACASAPAAAPGGAANAPAPQMTIERFLRAVNQNDLDTMGALFGTRTGSIAGQWGQREVDDRMFLLASLLRHTDYEIQAENIVPGRRDVATQFSVRMQVAQGAVTVPFTLVLTERNPQWLIEEIGIERITHPQRRP
jgi:hypothetical protein